MYEIARSSQFKRDLRLAHKRRKNLNRLAAIIDALAKGEQLGPECRDHALKGKYKGYRECHIEPDWLLVYKIDKGILLLVLSRTGSHSDLFDE